MYNSKRQKNIIIGSLLAIVCIMAIGYAAFATNLNISGSGAISSSWSVKITNIASKDIVGSAGNKTAPTYTDTTATFATTLQNPGDSITYDITVSNEGTLDAVLNTITLTNSNNPAITFETSGLTEGDDLLKNTTKTLTVKVTYKNSVTSQPENVTANLTVTLDFGQKGLDSNGIAVPPISTNDLKTLAVTTGDGLYADSVTSGRYFYRGTSVDNYITFNSETWRIISVESDGTLKIIRNEQLSSTYAWDSAGTRSSSTSTYCKYANNHGCNAWSATKNLESTPSKFIQYYPNGNSSSATATLSGTVTQDASLNTYLNGTYYRQLPATKVVQGIFNVSTPGNESDTETLDVDAEQEQQYQWKGYVALMTLNELLKASTSSGCTSLSAGYNDGNTSTCKSNNWLWPTSSTSSYEWTLSPYVDSYCRSVWNVTSGGYVNYNTAYASIGIRPVVFLKSDITLTGSGTSTDPYTITG